jgi:hypothetical protein
MIYIYLPNVTLFIYFYIVLHFSLIFSLFLSPITYLGLSGFLLFWDQLYVFHQLLDNLFMIRLIESGMHDGVTLAFNSLNNIDRFKKYYLQLKVILLLNVFKVIAYITPEKKENELENNLQHDYLEILNRNKHKREVNEVKEITEFSSENPETNENVIKND